MEDLELPMFDLSTISTATRNFSSTNVLGEGGFGTVYKVTSCSLASRKGAASICSFPPFFPAVLDIE